MIVKISRTFVSSSTTDCSPRLPAEQVSGSCGAGPAAVEVTRTPAVAPAACVGVVSVVRGWRGLAGSVWPGVVMPGMVEVAAIAAPHPQYEGAPGPGHTTTLTTDLAYCDL